MPQSFGEFPGVDGDRAGRGTHAVNRAGLFTLIDVIMFQLRESGRIFAGGSEAGYFALNDNALSGRQGKTF